MLTFPFGIIYSMLFSPQKHIHDEKQKDTTKKHSIESKTEWEQRPYGSNYDSKGNYNPKRYGNEY